MLILFVLFSMFLFCFSIADLNQGILMYDYFSNTNIYYYKLNSKNDLSSLNENLYYVKEASIDDKIKYNYQSVTYFDNFDFEFSSYEKSINEAYVFSELSDFYGKDIIIIDKTYHICGIIDYELSDFDNYLIRQTIFIKNDSKFEFDNAYVYAKNENLKQLFKNDFINHEYYIKIDDVISMYKKISYGALVLLFLSLALFNILNNKKMNNIDKAYREYLYSNSDLFVNKSIFNLFIFLVIIISSKFLMGFFIHKYQGLLVAEFSKSIDISFSVSFILGFVLYFINVILDMFFLNRCNK